MNFSQILNEDDSIGMSNFIALEAILADFYSKYKSLEQASPGNIVSNYFTQIIHKSKGNASENINKLSSLCTLSVLRLYKNALNRHYKTLKIIEPPSDFLLKAFSSLDIKKAYFTTSAQEPIICFYLPEDYQTSCLNVFASKFSAGSTLWTLKGVLCIRDQLVVPLTRFEGKKWVFDSKLLKNSKNFSFSKLGQAILELSHKGFTPISFFYFLDSVDVNLETLEPKILNQMNELRLKSKKVNILKSKKILPSAFREQVIKYSQSIDLFSMLKDYEKKIFTGKNENLNEQIKNLEFIKKITTEPIVVETFSETKEPENVIGNKFDYNTVNLDEPRYSFKFKVDIPQPAVKNSGENQVLNLKDSLSAVDLAKLKSNSYTWMCNECNFINEYSSSNLCNGCQKYKFCYGCQRLLSIDASFCPICENH